MHALAHRLDHFPAGAAHLLWRALLAMFCGFGASWERLMARAAPGAADDILWDDGEPDEATDRR